MTSTSDAFPRGSFIPLSENYKKSKGSEEQNLFGKGSLTAPKRKNTMRREKPIEEEHDGLQSNDTEFADVLSYGKISEGMLILGCIRKIKSVSIECELPGRTFGEIPLQHVSASYVKLVSEVVQDEKEIEIHGLAGIFSVGQFVPVRVYNVENPKKSVKITLSTNPANVNSHLRHMQFYVGNLVWGSISEKSDHGYVVDLGVTKTRTHLPFTSACPQHKPYEVGQVLFMSVTKIEKNKEASTLTVSTLTEDIDNSVMNPGSNLDRLIAGVQVEFTIEKVLNNGLRGSFLADCKGYINELYLTKPFEKVKKYKEGQKVRGRILYTYPLSRISHLTLKPLSSEISKKITIGSKMNCLVASKIDAGLVIKIDNTFRGFITNKRLLKCMSESEKREKETEELILEKFPLNSKQECTVLDYNHIEDMYICTFEDVDTFLNINNFTIGQTVKGVVKKLTDVGLIIQLGKVDAFVHNNHLSNAQYSENIKKQFKIGQKVDARVLSMDNKEEKVFLTMKPSLMKNTDSLMSYEQIIPGTEVYSGVVCRISKKGVLVVFFGDVKGWLPLRNIPYLQGNVFDLFYLGQTIQVLVASYDKEPVPRLTLTQNKMPNAGSSDEGIFSPSEDNVDQQDDQKQKSKITKKKRKASETNESLAEETKPKKKKNIQKAKVDFTQGTESKKEKTEEVVDKQQHTKTKRKKKKSKPTKNATKINGEPKQKKKKNKIIAL